MYQLQYDPGLTSYEIERRTAAGTNPAGSRRTSAQLIRESLVREDLWRLLHRAVPRRER
ncbi:MAG: hypothetical protein ACQERF_12165 [Actinomycetota bacterium]